MEDILNDDNLIEVEPELIEIESENLTIAPTGEKEDDDK